IRERFQADSATRRSAAILLIRILLDTSANRKYLACTLCPRKGTLRDRHGTSAQVAMDAVASARCKPRRRKRRQRTAKSCGPGAATLASIRAAQWRCGNGDNKGRSPGRARRKP